MAWEYWFIWCLAFWGMIQNYFFGIRSKVLYVLICVIMILVGGFRFRLGPDYLTYEYLYKVCLGYSSVFQFLSDDISGALEIGYGLTTYFISRFEAPYWVFQLIFISIPIFLKSYIIFKYLRFAFIGLLFYYIPLFFYADMVQIRQGFAAGILFYSTIYIVNKDVKRFLICCAIAYLFHYSSIVFVLAYWVGNSKIRYTWIFLTVILLFILSPLGLSNSLEPVLKYLPDSGVKETYLDYNKKDASGYGFSYNDIVKLLFFLFISAYNSYFEKKGAKFYLVTRNLFVFSLALYYFFKMEPIFAIRLPGYYHVYMGLVIPFAIELLWNKKRDYNIMFLSIGIYLILIAFRFSSMAYPFYYDYPNYIYNEEQINLKSNK